LPKQAYISAVIYDVYVKRLILPPTDHHIEIITGLAKLTFCINAHKEVSTPRASLFTLLNYNLTKIKIFVKIFFIKKNK